MPTPAFLTEGEKANFETIRQAIKNDDAGVMICEENGTGERVVVICAFSEDPETDEIRIAPLAKLFKGNPYEELAAPTQEME
jgi:hypothetical protein